MRGAAVFCLASLFAAASLVGEAPSRLDRAAIRIQLDSTQRSGRSGAESVTGYFTAQNNLDVPLAIDGDIDPADNLFVPHPTVYGMQYKARDADDKAWTDLFLYPAGSYKAGTAKLALIPENPVAFKAVIFGPACFAPGPLQLDFKKLIFRLKMRIAGAPTLDTFSEEFFYAPSSEESEM